MHTTVYGAKTVNSGNTSGSHSPCKAIARADGGPLVNETRNILHSFHFTREGKGTGSTVEWRVKWGRGCSVCRHNLDLHVPYIKILFSQLATILFDNSCSINSYGSKSSPASHGLTGRTPAIKIKTKTKNSCITLAFAYSVASWCTLTFIEICKVLCYYKSPMHRKSVAAIWGSLAVYH